MNKMNLKRAFVALALCTAGEVSVTPAGGLAAGITVVGTLKAGQAYLNQTDATNQTNSNNINASNRNISAGVAGGKAEEVKGAAGSNAGLNQ